MNEALGRISTSIVTRYGAGQLGAQIFRDTPAVLLPMFMTTMLGVPAWLAGIAILIPKLWVILCDPLVGAYSDRAKARHGRTPFLLVGAVLTSLSFVALFTITSYSNPYVAAAAICVLFFVASTAFSLFSVPYLAIASELSTDPHERTRIMVFRMVFTIIGVMLGVGLAQPLIFWLGGGAHGWHVMAIAFAGICLVSMLVTALGLRHVALLPGGESPPRLRDQLAPVFANRPYTVLLGTTFIQNIGQAASYTVIGFIFLYALDAIWLIPLFVLSMSLGSILSQPFWLSLSRRFGKERCYVAGSIGWAAVTATWFYLRPGNDVLVTLPLVGPLATQHVLVLVRGVFIGVVNSGFVLLALSMLTDTVDYQRQRFGVAHEGVFSGLFSAAEKLAFALGPLVGGIVLSLFGFHSSTGGAVAQSPQAITGILLLYSFIPAGAQLASLLLFSRYRLNGSTAGAPVPAVA
ncbi:MFS transporter [Sphingomonas sp. PL-96]|uniref:MFS transporter n=1 Tax=Sphingomonas sp. PL-96 TaxID=2887201 RepID=UPI001E58FB61|nr:MFS transporter [Sphingomonas sp. PL-96]MCC2976535.1 MFS transporter [Sphingomonas sp. PL-96]